MIYTPRREILAVSLISILYIVLSIILVGFKTDQLFLVFLVNILFYLNRSTRSFITGFSIFIIYWVLFDYMKVVPNYQVNPVAIQSLYEIEKSAFGISVANGVITPNEYFAIHSSSFLDLLTGLLYLCWVPVPLAFAAYLFVKHKEEFLNFSFTFLLTNLIGFVIYYVVPAAPPWYVKLHGFDFIPGTPGNVAGLGRFDQLTGTSIFQSLYAKGSNVFAAFPSLHSAYPLIVFYYGLRNKLGRINLLFAFIMIGIWFAAVYTGHHYIIDVLAGIVTAIAGIILYNKLIRKAGWFRKIHEWYLKRIAFN